ncbi:MAG: T9SS type A sorting domain-containing protein [Bacteroidetes bacterium]|nr:T9SS type A sorting domain-containing protein [Bacteroidota bacterium]
MDSIGRVILCGTMNRANGEEDRIFRLNPDGSFDSTFHMTTCYYELYKMIHLSNGKFLVGGWVSDYSETRYALWRIFPDGEIDTTFDTHCTWGAGGDFIVLPDHKIIATGQFKIPGIYDTICLCRFNENGELDTTFTWTKWRELIYSVGINYNKILIGGHFDTWHPNYSIKYNHFAIFNLDGTIDTTLIDRTFGPDSSYNYYPPGIMFFRSITGGKIYIGGYFPSFAGYDSFCLLRLYDISMGNAEIDNKAPDLQIYPNPASESVKIHCEIKADGYLEIRDVLGRMMRKCKVTRSSFEYQFDVHAFPAGIYFIRVLELNGKQTECRKLLVTKS